jgi:hypothetical protein
MQVFVFLLACLVCTGYAGRVRSSERMQSDEDVNRVTPFARLLLANIPAGRNVPGGLTHGFSRPALLDSLRHLDRIDMFFGNNEKEKDESKDKKNPLEGGDFSIDKSIIQIIECLKQPSFCSIGLFLLKQVRRSV